MTKEIRDIIAAFKVAQHAGRRTALATVVHVEGSSYRSPGARMLVEDNGRITGVISGGCLEGDALRRALQAINQGLNKLVTYNTLHEDDLEFGVQLGCNGIVHILFEPVDPGDANNPVAMLENACIERDPAVLVTLFSLEDRSGFQPGTCLVLSGGITRNRINEGPLATLICNDASNVLFGGTTLLKHYAEQQITAFFEVLQAPVSLVIVGAGNDARPFVDMAAVLGWQVTIIDGRLTHATVQRFPDVHKVIVAKPTQAIGQVVADRRTAFVLMTHNYNYDLAMLKLLLRVSCGYIGTLGPKKRLEKMLADLREEGAIIKDEQQAVIYGPTGLDIGAETPEEIALSVLSEIKAVMAEHPGGPLRLRQAGIHSRPAQAVVAPSNTLQHAE